MKNIKQINKLIKHNRQMDWRMNGQSDKYTMFPDQQIITPKEKTVLSTNWKIISKLLEILKTIHTKSFGSKYASNAAELYMSYLYWTYCTLSLTSILSFSSFSHHVASLMLSSVTRELTLSFRSLFSINKAVLSACNSTHCCCKASIKGWCPHSRSC